jgi:hypothetical protein
MSTEKKLAEMFGSEWRQHTAYPAYYFSRDGRCARVPRKAAPRLLVGCPSGSGEYRCITLCDGKGGQERVYLHRAVCELFNGPPKDLPHCRHLDGNAKNCAADNLAWGTAADNMQDMLRHGRTAKGKRNPQSKLNPDLVLQMREVRVKTGAVYRDIAAQFGVSTMTALRAIKGEAWK